MVWTASCPVRVVASNADGPCIHKDSFMPCFTKTEDFGVDKETDRQVGEVFHEIIKCHPKNARKFTVVNMGKLYLYTLKYFNTPKSTQAISKCFFFLLLCTVCLESYKTNIL